MILEAGNHDTRMHSFKRNLMMPVQQLESRQQIQAIEDTQHHLDLF